MIYFILLDYLKEQGVQIDDKWNLDTTLSKEYFTLQDRNGDGNIDLIWNSKVTEPNFEALKKKIPAKELEIEKNLKCKEVQKQKDILQYSDLLYNNNLYKTSDPARRNLSKAIEKSKSDKIDIKNEAMLVLQHWLTAEIDNKSLYVDISEFAEELENAILIRDNTLYRKESELKNQIMSLKTKDEVKNFEIKF